MSGVQTAGSGPPAYINAGSGSLAVGGGIAAGAYGAAAGPNGMAIVNNIAIQADPDGYGTLAELLRAPPQIRRRAAAPPPRRPIACLGRRDELDVLVGAIRDGRASFVTGEAGAGRTTLLAEGSNAAIASISDGVVLIEGTRPAGAGIRDLVQLIYDAIWDSGRPKRVVDAVIARADLAGIRPLVLIDGWTLIAEECCLLLDLLPQSAIVLTGSEGALGAEFLPIAVGPLDRDSAVDVLACRARLGAGRDRDLLERCATLLDRWPGAIATLGDFVASGRIELADAARVLEDAAARDARPVGLLPSVEPPPIGGGRAYRRLRSLLQARLTPDEMATLETIAVLPPNVSPAIVAATIEPGLAPRAPAAIASLEETGLVWTNSPRLRLDPGLRTVLQASAPATLDRLATALHDVQPTLDDADTWLAALNREAETGRWSQAIHLARRVAPMLAGEGRWDLWHHVAETAVNGARHIGDDAALAWALHERGTHALAMGRAAYATEDLAEALQIRRRLHDRVGAERTLQNARLGSGGSGTGGAGGRGGGGGRPGRRTGIGPGGGHHLLNVLTILGLVIAIGLTGVVGANILLGTGGGTAAPTATSPATETPIPASLPPTPEPTLTQPTPTPTEADATATATLSATPSSTSPPTPTPGSSTLAPPGALRATAQLVEPTVDPRGHWTGTLTVTVVGGTEPLTFDPDGTAAGGRDRSYPVTGDACSRLSRSITVRSSDGQEATVTSDVRPDSCETFSTPAPPTAGSPDDGVVIANCPTEQSLQWIPAEPFQEGTTWILAVETSSGGSWEPIGRPITTNEAAQRVALPCAPSVRWHVATIDPNGWQGEWSDWFAFKVQATAVPALTAGGTKWCGTEAPFDWTADPSEGISGYVLELRDYGPAAGADTVTRAMVPIETVKLPVSEPHATVSPVCGHLYQWRVASIDAFGVTGAFSDPLTFRVSDAPS